MNISYWFTKPSLSTFLGSGSHFPFSMHVEVFGPLSMSPEGQLRMTVEHSNAGCSYPETLIEFLSLMQSLRIITGSYKYFIKLVVYCEISYHEFAEMF